MAWFFNGAHGTQSLGQVTCKAYFLSGALLKKSDFVIVLKCLKFLLTQMLDSLPCLRMPDLIAEFQIVSSTESMLMKQKC